MTNWRYSESFYTQSLKTRVQPSSSRPTTTRDSRNPIVPPVPKDHHKWEVLLISALWAEVPVPWSSLLTFIPSKYNICMSQQSLTEMLRDVRQPQREKDSVIQKTIRDTEQKICICLVSVFIFWIITEQLRCELTPSPSMVFPILFWTLYINTEETKLWQNTYRIMLETNG